MADTRSFLLILILCYSTTGASSDGDTFTEAEKKAFVDTHNKLRQCAQPTAEEMHEVKWSVNLEELATKEAAKCIFDHDYNGFLKGFGENIHKGESTPEKVVLSFFSEIRFFYRDTWTCRAPPKLSCGHYTQVMTGAVREIGCGIKRKCFPGEDNINLVFCGYSAGNGHYKPGPACSKCPADRPCRNNLCSSNKDGNSIATTKEECAALAQMNGVTGAVQSAPGGAVQVTVALHVIFISRSLFAELL